MKNDSVRAIFESALKKERAKIKLIGDSITHGVGGSGWEQCGEAIVKGWAESPNGYCWANLFRDYMKEKYGATVKNKACTGTNVDFVMDNFSTLVESDDDVIICTIGTNNRHKYFADGEKPTKEEFLASFDDKIRRMYGMFSKTGIPTIFVANIPASAQNERDGENFWRILSMKDINESYGRLSRECGANVISMYDMFSEYCTENGVTVDELLDDGLHPNDRGYRVMFEILIGALGV